MLTVLLIPLFATTLTEMRQWATSCEGPDARLDRLATAIERGDIGAVRTHLDSGGDVDETWRDTRAPLLCRSLLLRSVWYGQTDIFRLLLQEGADPLSLPRESLGGAVERGSIEITRTLLAAGLRPVDNDEIVISAFRSKNPEMLELIVASGFSLKTSNIPSYYLSDDITRSLVPKHLTPNMTIHVGEEPCDVAKLFGLLKKNQDGCEGTEGPLWFHFVLTGRHQMVEFMIKNGADLTLRSEVWDGSDARPFTAVDIALRRRDKRMIDLLRGAGAPMRGVFESKR
jgi:ankyrin repeat protein